MNQEKVFKYAIQRRPAVRQRLNVADGTLTTMIEDGDFVQPIRIGRRSVGFIAAEVDAWFEARMAERDEAAKRLAALKSTGGKA